MDIPEYKTILDAHLNTAPPNCEPAQGPQSVNAAANELHSSPQAPPPGEASALVARLLTGSDQEIVDAGNAPFSVCRAELAKSASDPIPAAPSPTAFPLAEEPSVIPVPKPAPRPRLPQPRSNITARFVLLLSLLIFAAGLAVGYGVFGHRSKAASPVTSRLADLSPAVDHSDPPPPSSQPVATPNQSAHAATQSQLTPPASSSETLPSPTPDPVRHAITDPQTVSASAFHPSAPHGATQTALASARPTYTPPAPMHSFRSDTPIAAAKEPDIPIATALPTVVALAPETHVVPRPPTADTPGPAAASVGQLEPCQLLHSVQPVYPRKAKKLHLEGNVELRAVVGVDGTVESVSLVNGPALLAPAAIDAARNFLYKPALLNGKPIESVQTINMSFNLKK